MVFRDVCFQIYNTNPIVPYPLAARANMSSKLFSKSRYFLLCVVIVPVPTQSPHSSIVFCILFPDVAWNFLRLRSRFTILHPIVPYPFTSDALTSTVVVSKSRYFLLNVAIAPVPSQSPKPFHSFLYILSVWMVGYFRRYAS